jgi:hypothetical protein
MKKFTTVQTKPGGVICQSQNRRGKKPTVFTFILIYADMKVVIGMRCPFHVADCMAKRVSLPLI